jgi:hypothetical protein
MNTGRRGFLKIAGAAAAGGVPVGLASAEEKAAAPPGRQEKEDSAPFVTELFLDNHLLEVTPGVARRLHQPKKHLANPVVRCDRWWEANILEPYTTLYDEKDRLFKMWARTGTDWKSLRVGGHAAYMTYLTSTDGVHWEKPKLGVLEIAGRRDHNIVFTSDTVLGKGTDRPRGKKRFIIPSTPMRPQGKKAFFWSVVRHPHPRDASETFIALAIVQDHRRGAHLVTSPDGIHWSCADAPFWQTPHDVSGLGDDCLMHVLYDRAKRKWALYRRIIPEFSERMIANESDCNRKAVDRYYRSYGYAESADLQEWTGHRFMLSMDADDPADTELYQFSCHQFGQTYVGYLSVFHLGPQSIDIQLATSRDGLHWDRVRRGESFIPCGPLRYYDYMAMACSQPEPVVVNDTVYLYYAACNFPHSADITRGDAVIFQVGAALATFKRDRFASLETSVRDPGPCRVVTRPFTVRHPKLFLNAATWENGAIRAEVLTRDWQPVPGFTEAQARDVRGDALDHPVRWQDHADLGRLLSKEIRLKFYMTRARIHAMTLSHADRKLGAVEGEYRDEKPADSAPKVN